MLQELLAQVNAQKSTIDSHGNFPSDALKRINYQLRWDWNFHSNAMEGNSLTHHETRSVMINNITVTIIRQEQKEVYGKYLGDIQSGGDPDAFYAFMAKLVLDAQNRILDALL